MVELSFISEWYVKTLLIKHNDNTLTPYVRDTIHIEQVTDHIL